MVKSCVSKGCLQLPASARPLQPLQGKPALLIAAQAVHVSPTRGVVEARTTLRQSFGAALPPPQLGGQEPGLCRLHCVMLKRPSQRPLKVEQLPVKLRYRRCQSTARAAACACSQRTRRGPGALVRACTRLRRLRRTSLQHNKAPSRLHLYRIELVLAVLCTIAWQLVTQKPAVEAGT